MSSFRLTLLALLFHLLLARAAAAQPVDEPGIQPFTPPAPPAAAQITDIEVVEITPLPSQRIVPAPTLRTVPKRDRGPFVTLSAGGGYGGYAVLFGESISGPVVNGDLALTWGGGRARHGLRLKGYVGLMKGDYDALFSEEKPMTSRLYGASLGYLLQAGGFWFSAGWGVVHAEDQVSDPYDGDYDESRTFPEAVVSLGYDFRFTDNLGLRLGAEAGSFIVSWRGELNAALVLRL